MKALPSLTDPVAAGNSPPRQHHPAAAGVLDDDLDAEFREALAAEDREEEMRCRADVEGDL